MNTPKKLFTAAADSRRLFGGLFTGRRRRPAKVTSSYVEPVIGWNEEDFNTGLVKFGVSHYAPPTVKKINAPKRPELTFTDELPDAATGKIREIATA